MTKFSHLQVFIHVCRLRSIRKAAEEMSTSQPSVSKAIQQLEHELGVSLLQRLPRGVEPTVYGEILLRHAQFAMTELNNAKELIDGFLKGRLGSVRIGVSTAAARVLMPTVISEIYAHNPHVDIQVIEDTVEAVAHALRNGEVDIAFAPTPRSGTDRDIESFKLFDDQLVVVGDKNHPALKTPALSLRSMLDFPWVFVGNDPTKESQLVILLRKHDLPLPKWIIETNSVNFLMRFLINSNFLSYQSRRLVGTFSNDGIAIVPVPQSETSWPMMASLRKNAVKTPLIELVLERSRILSETISATV